MRGLAILLAAVWAPFVLAADLKITEKSTSSDANWTGTTTRWYSGTRWRIESRFEQQLGLADTLMRSPQPRIAAIHQCDRRQVVELDLDSREYMTFQLNESGFVA